MNIHVRWLIRADIPKVLAIECESDGGWSRDEIVKVLRNRNSTGMVAEVAGDVVGWMIYSIEKYELELDVIAVGDSSKLCGVGTRMVDKLKSKLSSRRRVKIVVDVQEDNDEAIKFFAKNGFLARRINRDYYEGSTLDAYRFEYDYDELDCDRASRLFVGSGRVIKW